MVNRKGWLMRYLLLLLLVLLILSNRPIKFNDLSKLKPTSISVEVKGHLNNAGTFQLDYPATIEDLLTQLDLRADSDYSHLNLNAKLFDKEVISIKEKSEPVKVSINSGSIQDLMSLKGIGRVMAERIIDYRTNVAPFKKLEELKNVKGIGEKIFQDILDFINL